MTQYIDWSTLQTGMTARRDAILHDYAKFSELSDQFRLCAKYGVERERDQR